MVVRSNREPDDVLHLMIFLAERHIVRKMQHASNRYCMYLWQPYRNSFLLASGVLAPAACRLPLHSVVMFLGFSDSPAPETRQVDFFFSKAIFRCTLNRLLLTLVMTTSPAAKATYQQHVSLRKEIYCARASPP